MDEEKKEFNIEENGSESTRLTKKQELKLKIQNESIFKKIFFWLSFIIVGVFSALFFFGKSTSKLTEEIKEKKKKDKELEKKAEEITKEIESLEKESKSVEDKIRTKEKEFSDFVSNTKEEVEVFAKEKADIVDTKDNTELNMDWVKHRFGGSIEKDD